MLPLLLACPSLLAPSAGVRSGRGKERGPGCCQENDAAFVQTRHSARSRPMVPLSASHSGSSGRLQGDSII